MTTTAKGQRDKPHASAPRLLPRPTAASAARAARNATNRNVTLSVCQRQSPTRISSPASSRGKGAAGRSLSKTDVKINHNHENDVTLTSSIDNQKQPLLPQESESFVIEITCRNMDDDYVPTCYDASELNETDNFEIKHNVDMYQEEKETRNFEDDLQNEQVIDNIIKSRPQTPMRSSRPQTPRSLQSSRPQTPRMPSRPTTPAYPVQRHSTPTSYPNTPQRLATPTRPKTPTSPLLTFNRNPTIVATCCQSRTKKEECVDKVQEDIKSAYTTKQKQFHQLKKELDLKQQTVLEVFNCLRDMQERMLREGVPGNCEGSHRQELLVFNVADWSAEEVSQLCRDTASSSTSDTAVEIINTTMPIDECVLAEMDTKVATVPACFADLCLQAFAARQEIIDWVKELVEKNDLQQEEGGGECFKRIAHYNAQGLELCDALHELKARAEDAVDTVTQLSKRACRERSALLAVGETLVREIARLRQDIETRTALVQEMREIRVDNDVTKALEETRRELEEERAARNATRDKLANTESLLRQTRTRVTKMDRQLREAEASIASLTGTVKTLEDQSRSREVQLEARARKLKESLKTGEVASGQIAQQRDALQAEILDLKEQIEKMTSQHKSTIQDLNCQLKNLNNSLEEQQRMTQKEVRLKEAAEAALQDNHNAIEDLKLKIIELENNRPNPDLPTEREMDLWAELQATKDTLRITEDEVTTCKREKVRFLETLTKITESENKVGLQQKLAAELLSKEEIVGKMQTQIRELTKNIKLNEQKVIQYEQYVRDLQAHNRAVANCLEAPNGISYQDLQQEIMNLKMGLLEAVHRNEELSEMLVQKEQQLEQQDKTSRAQARVIKVREELINMLKNKETEQSRELAALQQDLEHRMKIVDEVNKQIAAKAEEIQQLFTTLENKQQQIHRLEKIVLALEEQQRRAQAQRTRHEEKIAALEHELAAGGNRRERKFLFF